MSETTLVRSEVAESREPVLEVKEYVRKEGGWKSRGKFRILVTEGQPTGSMEDLRDLAY